MASQQTVGQIDEYVAAPAHKAEVDNALAFGQLAPQMKTYLKTVKDLMRRARDEGAKKGHGSADNSEGDPRQVLEQYNLLVASSNSVTYR